MKATLITVAIAGLLITQGEVDFNRGGNGSGRYEKAPTFVLTPEAKSPSPKTPARRAALDTLPASPIGVQPRKIIRIPVTPEDILPFQKRVPSASSPAGAK
jgi:hypothetical protein